MTPASDRPAGDAASTGASPDDSRTPSTPTAEEQAEWKDAILDRATRVESAFLIYLSALSYSILTIGTSTDRQLVLNEQARLPVLNVDIPFYVFFLVGPILCIGTYLAFQLQASTFYRLLAESGLTKTVYRRRWYTWMGRLPTAEDWWLTDWIRGGLGHVVNWWLLPIVLGSFALGFLRTHDKDVAGGLLGLFAVGVLCVFYFRWERHDFWKHRSEGVAAERHRSWWRDGGILALALVSAGFVAGYGLYLGAGTTFGGQLAVNLDNEVLITSQDRDLSRFWVDLSDQNLQRASLRNTVLTNGNLRHVDLTDATLENASLQGSQLDSAIARRANFTEAKLDSAHFYGATLHEATFTRASLSDVNVVNANLRFATFGTVLRVENARFTDANLECAALNGLRNPDQMGQTMRERHSIGNTVELDKEITLVRANLSGAELSNANLQNANMQRGTLIHARAERANFQGADLYDANFRGASLWGADFAGTDTDLRLASFKKAVLDSADFGAHRPGIVDALCKAHSADAIQPERLRAALNDRCDDLSPADAASPAQIPRPDTTHCRSVRPSGANQQ